MRADTEITQIDGLDPYVIIWEENTVILFVMLRWEYRESPNDCIARAHRIADFLTNHGTKQGWRSEQD